MPSTITAAERAARKELLDTFVGLPQIAGLLNEVFGLTGYDEIGDRTPRLWWRRSYENWGISHPMPQPHHVIGELRKRPFWKGKDVIVWYGEWKGERVPRWVR